MKKGASPGSIPFSEQFYYINYKIVPSLVLFFLYSLVDDIRPPLKKI